MAAPTLVAHLDVDAFYVAVECERKPELRGLPVVVAGAGPRAVVTTASYEARRHGVGSAMPASRARRLCPQAVFIEPDFRAYREVSRRLMAVVRAHVDQVEVIGLDEAYLDVSAFAFPRSAMRRVLDEIARETGMTCSVGIGPNKLVAKVASDAEKPRGFVVLSREQACARFASSPPGLLPGIGPKTAARLAALGLRTIGALASAAPELLARHFGPRLGHELARRARFHHDGEVTQARKVHSASRERTFDRDVADPVALADALAVMSAELCSSLGVKGRSGRTIGIKVRLDDFQTITRARTLERPTRDAATVRRVALELLDGYRPPRPVRLLGVRVAGLQPGAESHEGGHSASAGAGPGDGGPGDGGPGASKAGQLSLPLAL